MPLFAQDTNMGQAIGITALISTIATGLLALIGTYLSNRQAARTKADDRDNDDKWRMLGELQKENEGLKAELAQDRRDAQTRYDLLAREHTDCLQNFARVEERVGFLEDWATEKGLTVPRKRPPGGSAGHAALPTEGK